MGLIQVGRRLFQAWSAALDSLLGGTTPGQVPIWDNDTLLWHLEQGGYLKVADHAARDAIPAGVRHAGLHVITQDDGIGWVLFEPLGDDNWTEWDGLELAFIQQSNGALTGYFLNYDENALAVGRGAWVPTPPGTTITPFDYNYSNNAAMADPGAETFRTDATLISTVTQIAISNDPIGPVSDLLAALGNVAAPRTRIDQDAAGIRWGRWTITGWTDNGTWHLLDVTLEEVGTTDNFQNGATCTTYWEVEGGGAVATEHNQLQGLGWTSSAHTGGAGDVAGWLSGSPYVYTYAILASQLPHSELFNRGWLDADHVGGAQAAWAAFAAGGAAQFWFLGDTLVLNSTTVDVKLDEPGVAAEFYPMNVASINPGAVTALSSGTQVGIDYPIQVILRDAACVQVSAAVYQFTRPGLWSIKFEYACQLTSGSGVHAAGFELWLSNTFPAGFAAEPTGTSIRSLEITNAGSIQSGSLSYELDVVIGVNDYMQLIGWRFSGSGTITIDRGLLTMQFVGAY